MDIKILDSHLREYLDTKATPMEIAKYVSLCGPTFDRTTSKTLSGKTDYIYEIEVTTNRVDAASVVGIAREATAILPQFGIKASLKIDFETKINEGKIKNGLPLKIVSDPKLEKRLTGVVLENIKNWESPKWMKERLGAAGMRSINTVVDITNYVMLTIGHPCHAFDYDKIAKHTIIVRESKKGEKITTFDGKEYSLMGGDILFEDGEGKIIDLPGIMGLKNSVVSKDTKRVLLFFDNNEASKIRRTSMSLGIRTIAATLNEKSVDPELVPTALSLGVDLYKKLCGANIASGVFDIYKNPYKGKNVETSKEFIDKILGVEVDKKRVDELLKALGFSPKWKGDDLNVSVPSFRSEDINIPEDIIEEVARIYGYQNLPSAIMDGSLPDPVYDMPFEFENKLRQTLKALGGTEVLTYSLVSKDMATPQATHAGGQVDKALKLSNPLGSDTEYLRTSLKPSLVNALSENKGAEYPYHIFEIANVYIPNNNALPDEKMMLSGILVNYDFRNARGVIEELFHSLNILEDVNLEIIGDCFYYEYGVCRLRDKLKPKTFTPLPKYPPQIEDMTISIPEETLVGNVIQSIKQASKLVSNVELVDIYERNFTFRIYYQHPDKTLSDKEVQEVRKKIEKKLSAF